MKKFPTIGEYNQAIQKKGNTIFTTLRLVELIPSRTLPIKVFLFGSGAYAAVFKGRILGKLFALRVFLEAGSENVTRYEKICSHLHGLNSTWKVNCEFLPQEISVKDEKYPILKMDWIEGILINDFVTENLYSQNVLENLQREIVNVAHDLDKNKVGHGDIQSGNIIIVGSSDNFNIKLIDYDGMYTPNQSTSKSIENGRSEFNHPERNKMHFGPFVDRFPFWVILCALEALKFDSSLWKEVMQGGFNTLDNFLFLRSDFVNPNTSKLIKRLKSLNQNSVDYYLDKIIAFSKRSIYETDLPTKYSKSKIDTAFAENKKQERTSSIHTQEKPETPKKFLIKCNKPGIQILSSKLEKIGSLPLELDKMQYSNKIIIATDGNQLKRIQLFPHKHIVNIEWVEKDKLSNSRFNTSSNKNSQTKTENSKSYTSSENQTAYKSSKSTNQKNSTEQNYYSNSPGNSSRQVKSKVKSNSLKWLVIIPVILIVMAFINSYLGIYDFEFKERDTPTKVSINQTGLQKELIKKFIKAEEQRDWDKIKNFFAHKPRRYWDLYDPYLTDIKWRYIDTWKITSLGNNDIQKIRKVRENQFDVETIYTYYDKNKKEHFRTKSLVRFEFDKNNKIRATYAAKPSTPKKIIPIKESSEVNTTMKLSSEQLDIKLRKKIKEFLEAEDNRDLRKIYRLISPTPRYYLGERYPYFKKISSNYKKSWEGISTESIEIMKIVKIDNRRYNVELEYTWYSDLKNKLEVYHLLRQIQFNESFEIDFYKELKSIKLKEYSENTGLSEETGNDNQYIYRTTIHYTGYAPSLWEKPNINSKEIYRCDRNDIVYVIDNSGSSYYKVRINGYIGYIAKAFLTNIS